MRVRLKGKFDKEVILRTSTGLGWDPVTGAVTCTDEYWDDFAKNKKWANAAKKQPLKNFDLYCEAFGNARGLENPTTEHVDTIPIPDVDGEVGVTSHSLGSDDDFVTTMRAGLNTARKGLNVASSSKGIGKKSARSCKRPVGDPEAKALLGRLVASIETRRSSKATSSSATQSPTTRSLLQKCQDLVKGMDLDDDTSVTFLEAIAWYPHMQQLFMDMTETQRFTYILAGWEGSAHDARVLADATSTRDKNFPNPPPGKYYLVDSAYANTNCFLAPYRGSTYHLQEYRARRGRPRTQRELFNYTHSSLRNSIERTFGVWKARFRILKCINNYPIEKQIQIPVACAVLHNFIHMYNHNDELLNQYTRDGVPVVDIDPENADQDVNQNHNPDRAMEQNHNSANRREMNILRDEMAASMWGALEAYRNR
ncbi:uncharacterized protein LOC112092215 [Morus notabilis]|uniref:uncharacterized protein LOC112092215 n=1 Tax=Morus notabilis TaxID=981085 RepID=UPI000CED22EB|nr:uncharacterized protein LOC112092215 [Morus notabilis]